MELVEDQEVQRGSVPLEELALLGTREHQLQHHVVRQQDVGGILQDLLPGLALLLARVSAIGHRRSRKPHLEELVELLDLAVRQGVHGVDHDGLDAFAAALTEHSVHDGHDVGERLARPCSRREDIGGTLLGGLDRLTLVTVEREGDRGRARALRAEDVGASGVEKAIPHEFIDAAPGLKRRVEAEPRIGPLCSLDALLLDLVAQTGVADVHKPLGERLVVVDELSMNPERVHAPSLRQR